MYLGEMLKPYLIQWIHAHHWEYKEWVYAAIVTGIILVTALVLHFLLHSILLRSIRHYVAKKQIHWSRALTEHRPLRRIALVFQGLVLLAQVRLWIPNDSATFNLISMLAHLWILFFSLLAFFALLNFFEDILKPGSQKHNLPLRGIFQSIKLIAALMTVIFAISLLIGKSPIILLGGLGALAAVFMLVFKDVLLGFVAGIQLSANDMLALGDWLEMPKYNADGEVIDISLTTVKVRNGDNTITTIPAYALIADSFKNWRGMNESGGRRIKRAIFIDATSVQFLQPDDIERLRHTALLTDYINQKVIEIEEENQKNGLDPSSPINGRHLTNLGTLRAYLIVYLRQHKSIHTTMTQVVRQLAPEPNGIPLEIYAYANDTNVVNYEAIQADIFDHIFAILPEFGLRIYQAPSGYDMQKIGTTNGS